MQKLWPLYACESMPACASANLTFMTRVLRDNGEPSVHKNNGPLAEPLTARYLVMIATGHMAAWDFPMYMNTPWRNGSVLVCLMWT